MYLAKLCYNRHMTDFILKNVREIDKMILEGDYPNVSDFIEELKVTDRTARRYIKFMKETLYLPLEYDSHKKGYYYKNTHRTLKSFFDENPDYSYKIIDEDEKEEKRKELLDILISNVTSKGLACKTVSKEIKEHIISTEKNLHSCKSVEEILLYYDFALRAKTGNEVATELRLNGLLCFESPEVADQVNRFRKK